MLNSATSSSSCSVSNYSNELCLVLLKTSWWCLRLLSYGFGDLCYLLIFEGDITENPSIAYDYVSFLDTNDLPLSNFYSSASYISITSYWVIFVTSSPCLFVYLSRYSWALANLCSFYSDSNLLCLLFLADNTLYDLFVPAPSGRSLNKLSLELECILFSLVRVVLVNFEPVVDISSLEGSLVKEVSFYYLNFDLRAFYSFLVRSSSMG